jgi:hypothetical protein
MATKRYMRDGLVIRRLAPNATPPQSGRPRISRPISALNRDGLVRALLAEIAIGNSMTKLYATLLAREILNSDPKLARKYRGQLEAAQD